ncbi:MAG: response regulator [Eubacteriales bacterium]|nr:response regulator [Eubacteriales bacterium]MDD4512519.1 response regulator [Eubacteriales bacterium]
MSDIPSRPMLMIADSVAEDREYLSDVFKDTYEIIEADDGDITLELLERNRDRITVLLLSLNLPSVNGYDILRCMDDRGYLKYMPVVVLSDEPHVFPLIKCFQVGASDVLCKPFRKEIIRKRVHNILVLSRYRHRLEIMRQRYELPELSDSEATRSTITTLDTLFTRLAQETDESVEHMTRIRQITMLLLTQMNALQKSYIFNPRDIDQIAAASMLHDAGKLLIPYGIIDKHAKLTEEERHLVEEHTILGCKVLETITDFPSPSFHRFCADICRYHHERIDGRGYPYGIMNEDIPLYSQAVGLSDVYASLKSPNAYKPAFTPDTALEMILSGECGGFHPLLLEAMKQISSSLTSGQ